MFTIDNNLTQQQQIKITPYMQLLAKESNFYQLQSHPMHWPMIHTPQTDRPTIASEKKNHPVSGA